MQGKLKMTLRQIKSCGLIALSSIVVACGGGGGGGSNDKNVVDGGGSTNGGSSTIKLTAFNVTGSIDGSNPVVIGSGINDGKFSFGWKVDYNTVYYTTTYLSEDDVLSPDDDAYVFYQNCGNGFQFCPGYEMSYNC